MSVYGNTYYNIIMMMIYKVRAVIDWGCVVLQTFLSRDPCKSIIDGMEVCMSNFVDQLRTILILSATIPKPILSQQFK